MAPSPPEAGVTVVDQIEVTSGWLLDQREQPLVLVASPERVQSEWLPSLECPGETIVGWIQFAWIDLIASCCTVHTRQRDAIKYCTKFLPQVPHLPRASASTTRFDLAVARRATRSAGRRGGGSTWNSQPATIHRAVFDRSAA